jgi:SAM-dependent methyltransferase
MIAAWQYERSLPARSLILDAGGFAARRLKVGTMPEAEVVETKGYYEEYPFIEGGAPRIAWWQDYMRDFLPDAQVKDRLIGDIGSGVGEISRGLANRGGHLVCLDLTLRALRRNREINPEAELFNGSALNLPFADGAFDHTISIGVLMVTPDCRKGMKEAARVTAPGGTVVLFIYNYWCYLNLAWHVWAPIRKTLPLASVPRWLVRVMQPFVRSHLGMKLDEPLLRRLLGDKLWTPHATFHTKKELVRWAAEDRLSLVRAKLFYHNYAWVMSFKKAGAASPTPKKEIELRCLSCGQQPISRSIDGYSCNECGASYPIEDGISLCLV